MTRNHLITAICGLTVALTAETGFTQDVVPVPVNVTWSGHDTQSSAITPWGDSLRGWGQLIRGEADYLRARGQYENDYQRALSKSYSNQRDYNALRMEEIATEKQIREQNQLDRMDRATTRGNLRFLSNPLPKNIRNGLALNYILEHFDIDADSYALEHTELSEADLQAIRLQTIDGFTVDAAASKVARDGGIAWTLSMMDPTYSDLRGQITGIVTEAAAAARNGDTTDHLLAELDEAMKGFTDRNMVRQGSRAYAEAKRFSRELHNTVAHLGDDSVRNVSFKPHNLGQLVRHLQLNQLSFAATDSHGIQTYARIHKLLASSTGQVDTEILAAR